MNNKTRNVTEIYFLSNFPAIFLGNQKVRLLKMKKRKEERYLVGWDRGTVSDGYVDERERRSP